MYYIIINLLFSGLFFGISCAFVAFFISPLQFLKVGKQSTNRAYYDIIVENFKEGGVLIFFRGAFPYAMMNFYSSMSFGFAERCSEMFGFMALSLIWNSITRSFLGSLFETVISLYSEIIEISRNKGVRVNMKSEYAKLFFPVFIRNAIFWNGAVLASELECSCDFGIVASFFISLFFGVLFGTISIPFDVIATKICSNSIRIGGVKGVISFFRNYESYENDSGNKKNINLLPRYIFVGLSIRLIQVAIFSFTTAFTIKKYDIFVQYLSGFLNG